LWLAASSEPAPNPVPPQVKDDLELVEALFDAGPEPEAPHDVLVAGERDLYLARAAEHDVIAQPKGGGDTRTLATLEQPAYDMTLAGGALWLTTRATSSPRSPDGKAPTDSGVVARLPLSGGKPAVLTTGLSSPRTIACDGEWVFVVDTDDSEAGLLQKSTIVRIPAKGGPPTVVARSDGEIDAIALDGPSIYWTDRLDGSILSAAKTGGSPKVLASERGLPEKLRAYGGALYWIERRSESLWTMPLSGGTPRQMTQDLAGFAHVVVDGRGVWWTNEAAIDGAFRVLVAPGPTGQELEGSDIVSAVDALATDGHELYWYREGVVSRVTAPGD
jgi:hypothetical protein